MVAVRPPEYWPRLSYLALMARADPFVLADTFQYSRQSFQNRARLRTPQGWQWITVPLKARQHGVPIVAAEIDATEPWSRKHWRSFTYNYRSAPFFAHYEPDFRPLFDRPWTHLADLTCATAAALHRLFALESTLVRASALPGRPVSLPGLLEAVGEGLLLVPPEAAAHDARQAAAVSVLDFEVPRYRQVFEGFEPALSAVDLLFNYGPEARAVLQRGIRSVTPV